VCFVKRAHSARIQATTTPTWSMPTALFAWASEQRGLDRLEIRIMARGSDSVASQCAAGKTGFVYEGIRRSYVPATGATFADKLYALGVRR